MPRSKSKNDLRLLQSILSRTALLAQMSINSGAPASDTVIDGDRRFRITIQPELSPRTAPQEKP